MMQNAVGLLSLMFFGIVSVSLGQTSLTENSTGHERQACIYFGNTTKIAHIGWPFELRCIDGLQSNLFSQIRRKYNISCTIKDPNGTVLWSSTFQTTTKLQFSRRDYPRIDVTNSLNSTYSIEIKVPHDDFCGVSEVLVVGKNYKENYNCMNLPSSFDTPVKYSLRDPMREMTCGVAYKDPIKLYGSDSEYTYEWWYNCSSSLPKNVVVNEKTTKYLRFYNVTFSIGGEYVCAVRYKDQVRFLFRHVLCVTRPTSKKTTMKCPKRVGGKEGSNLELTCYVDVGVGRHLAIFSPWITWYNFTHSSPGVPICQGGKSYITQADVIIDNDEVKCINVQPKINVYNQVKTCFRYEPPPDVDVQLKSRYNITLQIKNLRQWDVGNYTVTHQYSGRKISRTIEVYLDTSKILMNSSVKAAVGVAITILLILWLIICCWRKYDILWFYKKYFGPYEMGGKKTDVLLLYHYSRDGMRVCSKLRTEKFIENIQYFLDEKGLTFHDENRDDVKVQNITKLLDDCHRILIIINEEIAFDEWDLHKVYAAIENFAKGGSNVIFISLPGLKRKFRNAPNQSQIALKHAMKIGTTIDWSGKVPFDNRFKRRLEYVLPKKKPRNSKDQTPSPARALVHTAL